MTFPLLVFSFGALLLMAGLHNQSLADAIRGVVAPPEPQHPAEDAALAGFLGGGSGASVAPGAGGAVGAAVGAAASGDWGGSKAYVDQAIAIGKSHGLTVDSTKRATKMTLSGNVSDHWVGCKTNYAADQGGSVSAMDAAAQDLARAFGFPDWKGVQTITVGGFRLQLLYRTMVGGNHFNHVHFGAKKVG